MLQNTVIINADNTIMLLNSVYTADLVCLTTLVITRGLSSDQIVFYDTCTFL